MMEIEQTRQDQPSLRAAESAPAVASVARPRSRARNLSLVGAALLGLAVLGGGYFTWNNMFEGCLSDGEEQDSPPGSMDPNDHRRWERPLVALVLSGQMHGYIHPCGCSSPQYGGLIRRYNFIESLLAGTPKQKGWDVVGIDLGDLVQLKGIHNQNMLKYELSVKALNLMKYHAIGIGQDEILAPLPEALTQIYDEKRPLPRPLALTLAQTAPGQLYHGLNVRPYEIVQSTKPKIGIISMMGPDIREPLKNRENFLNNTQELLKALRAFADAGVEIGVILHHEEPKVNAQLTGIQRLLAVERERKERARLCAAFCAKEREKNPKIPPIHLMMILTDEPEPPAIMKQLDSKLPTQVIEIGHKGKYVGLVGVYREGKSYRLQYQIVPMGPDWETKDNKKKAHPVIALMERYNQELKRQDMLAKYPRSLHYNQIPPANEKGLKAVYVGSERCGNCHDHAYAIWKGDPKNTHSHAHATETLENLNYPAGRQYDPECIMCHTVGFKHPRGYHDPAKVAQLQEHNAKLRGVGCESCHGPGSEHVKDPENKNLHPFINPFGPSPQERKLETVVQQGGPNPQAAQDLKKLFDTRMRVLEQFCTKCHDQENDVNWGKAGNDLVDKWIGKGLIHRTPKNKEGAPPAKETVTPAPLTLEPANIIPLPGLQIEIEKKK